VGAAIGHLLLDTEYERVAVIHRDDIYGHGFREAIQDVLCYPKIPACAAASYAVFTYDPAPQALAAEQALVAGQVGAFAPDAVVVIALLQDGLSLLKQLSMVSLDADLILPDGMQDPVIAAAISNPSVLCRVLGTGTPPEMDVPQAFVARYQERFGRAPPPYAANAYDAAYVLALAAAAVLPAEADPALLTGALLAEGLARVSGGAKVVPGPDAWAHAQQAIGGSPFATVDYDGASGPVDFDAQGDVVSAVGLWRFNLTENAPESLGVIVDEAGNYTPPPDVPASRDDPVCAQIERELGL
jgi:ABC-type branched-subunit amino acid transport system substrate-binding protein